eukprot:CAMPEP_0171029090 /NCGR_PEP_ID=MMETSP0736-20130129/36167_1 /TAXON_ID=186038 /ORGANISM="Fragilariopsis kerguelensis, Strain L26-C5" /LENGTH=79 /DNA_ID=CAMNT_0011470743 /DNA_START=108 /DNA_END=344 /DNA_ORIENTATION=-
MALFRLEELSVVLVGTKVASSSTVGDDNGVEAGIPPLPTGDAVGVAPAPSAASVGASTGVSSDPVPSVPVSVEEVDGSL